MNQFLDLTKSKKTVQTLVRRVSVSVKTGLFVGVKVNEKNEK